MAENLNYDTLSNYCYDNNPDNCKIYGRLYTWASAMGKSEDDCGEGHECGVTEFPHQGVCPEGWHLPIEEEWLSLKAYIDTDVGKKLKSEEGWSDKGKGLDTYGFSALPAGGYYGSGDFFDVGEQAFFWSATESENDNIYAYNVYIINLSDLLLNAYDHKDGTYSVRCLKD